VHGLVVTLSRVTEEVIAAGRELEVIGRTGVGLDNIDVAAATRCGIPVVYTPGANTVSVAEHVLGVALALARKYPQLDREPRAGNWGVRDQLGCELTGKTFGFVGLGRIGQLTARKVKGAFGAEILAYDPYLPSGAAPDLGAIVLDGLDDLLWRSDVISIHVPLTLETRGMIGVRELAIMKTGAFLINAARGPVVDEEALADALRSGTIAGAALDVFSDEPLGVNHPLYGVPNLLLTPHMAGMTVEAINTTARWMVADILAVLDGRHPEYVANPEVLGRRS
jgi:D-3-phosphoglycerate dehydrogenase / 2-oxoglutarate reductase